MRTARDFLSYIFPIQYKKLIYSKVGKLFKTLVLSSFN